MKNTLDLCKKLIMIGKADIVNDKLELYHLAGRLTDDEYSELITLMSTEKMEV